MTATTAVTSDPEATPPPVWRAAGVSMGPSLMLSAALAAGLGLSVQRRLSGWPRGIAGGLADAAALSAIGYLALGRRWHTRWGATDAEVEGPWPGDEIVADPSYSTTRAITIDAPREGVWRWLVQIGQGRGGLYSYDWLENLAGLDFHSIDQVRPDLQHLQPGDAIPLSPGGRELIVEAIDPGHYIVTRLNTAETEGEPGGTRMVATWSFLLKDTGDGRTRFIARWRGEGKPRFLLPLMYLLAIEMPHFVMERKMLLGLKERAERVTRGRAPPPGRPGGEAPKAP